MVPSGTHHDRSYAERIYLPPISYDKVKFTSYNKKASVILANDNGKRGGGHHATK